MSHDWTRVVKSDWRYMTGGGSFQVVCWVCSSMWQRAHALPNQHLINHRVFVSPSHAPYCSSTGGHQWRIAFSCVSFLLVIYFIFFAQQWAENFKGQSIFHFKVTRTKVPCPGADGTSVINLRRLQEGGARPSIVYSRPCCEIFTCEWS